MSPHKHIPASSFVRRFQGISYSTKPVKILSRRMTQQQCRDVDCLNARFGFSLANMGDVDRDGYEGELRVEMKGVV